MAAALTLLADRSRDAAYLGKILDGFTLAQKPLEQKTVSLHTAAVSSWRKLLLTPLSLRRSSLHQTSPETTVPSISSVLQ